MKIIVAIKQVPERDAPITIAPSHQWFAEQDLAYTINEPDAYALEEALQLKDKVPNSEVIVLSLGPERVTATLREALAKGADRAIHVDTEANPQQAQDTLALAQTLAAAIRPESPDLILTGLQSDDLGLGQTGVILAELLGIPHATLILEATLIPTGLRLKRELEDGWFQHLDMPLPALLTIQSGGNKLRYATLLGIKKARGKPTDTITPEAPTTTPTLAVTRVYLPEKQKQTQLLTGTPKEIAAQLVDKLKFEVKVL